MGESSQGQVGKVLSLPQAANFNAAISRLIIALTPSCHGLSHIWTHGHRRVARCSLSSSPRADTGVRWSDVFVVLAPAPAIA